MKRAADRQLTKDDDSEAEEWTEGQGEFKKAPAEVLAKRRIVKARRLTDTLISDALSVPPITQPKQGAVSAAPTNPFASLGPSAIVNGKKDEVGLEDLRSKESRDEEAKDGSVPQSPARVTSQKTALSEVERATTPTQEPAESTKAASTSPREQQKTADTSSIAAGKAESSRGPQDVVKEAEEPSVAVEGNDARRQVAEETKAKEHAVAETKDHENQENSEKPTSESTDPESKAEGTSALTKSTEEGNVEATKGSAQKLSEGSENASASKPMASDSASKEGEEKSGNQVLFGSGKEPKVSFGLLGQTAPNDPQAFAEMARQAKPEVEDPDPREGSPAMKPVDNLVTGEEEDDVLMKKRAKIFGMDKQGDIPRWKEEGVGLIKVNYNPSTKKYRLVMRAKATLKLLLNTPVWKEMILDRASDTNLRTVVVDSDASMKSVLLRFPKERDLDEFLGMMEMIQKEQKEEGS